MSDNEESLDSFLSGLGRRLADTANKTSVNRIDPIDEGLLFATTPAPNAIEWATDSEFLGVTSLYTHVRQYQIIRDLFQLRCPLPSCNDQSAAACDCWGKGREYLESENLLIFNKTIGEDSCPCCGTTRSEFIEDKLLKMYDSLHLVVGMRGGKSSVSATIGTYIEHRLIVAGHLYNGLDKYFQQLPGQKFDMTFIASTDTQSKDTIWAKFTELRRNSYWFGRYSKWAKSKEIGQKTPNGLKPLEYGEYDKEIRNDFIGLKISSLNSNSSGLAGRTRVAAFIDEIARFEITDSSRGADEAYAVLDHSLKTVRGKTRKDAPWFGTMVSISSPISIEDKAMRILKQAPSIKGMYYGHYATWDFNPELPREMFDDDFVKDPVGTMRDFGAQPPSAASPLISDPVTFKELAVQKDLLPTATFRPTLYTDRVGRDYVSMTLDHANLCQNGERYLCFDASSSFDQFAGACAHGEWVDTPEGEQLVTVYDWVVRLLPEAKPRRDIWFDWVIQTIDALSKYYIIGKIEFDRWNSTYLIQQIRDRGIIAEMKGTTYQDFVKFVADAYVSRVKLLPPAPNDAVLDPPQMSAAGLVFYEMDRLEKDATTNKIHNPRKGERRGYNSDDVATCVVHVNSMVQGTIVDISDSNTRKARRHREETGGVGWSNKGGSLYRPKQSKRGW
jgi:hypothetical protein